MSQIISGFAIVWTGALILWGIKRSLFVNVENESELLVTRFGKLIQVVKEPGAHFCPHVLPWVSIINVSKKIDHRHYTDLQINDIKGTALVADLWTEFRIIDSKKALFEVEDWEESMKSLIINFVSSYLSAHEFQSIHTNRLQLAHEIQEELKETINSWGIELSAIFIRKISLNSDISLQMLNAVAAKLERVKANIEEEGRLKVIQMEAETKMKIAELTAHAKGQYPKAIGASYLKLSHNKKILKAYNELFELSQVRPHRTTTFHGFDESNINVLSASLLANHSNKNEITSSEKFTN